MFKKFSKVGCLEDRVFNIFLQSKAQSRHFSRMNLQFFHIRKAKRFGLAFLIIARIWHELHSENLIQLLFIILGILNADVM